MSRHVADVAGEIDRELEAYIEAAARMVGMEGVTAEQREGIKQYYRFAQAMMVPLLAADLPGES